MRIILFLICVCIVRCGFIQLSFDSNADDMLKIAAQKASYIFEYYVSLTVPITVFFSYWDLEEGVLANAGSFFCDDPLQPFIRPPAALYATTGRDMMKCDAYYPGLPYRHISIYVSRGSVFFSGDVAEESAFDLVGILLHEMMHGFGIVSLILRNSPFISPFDALLLNMSGSKPHFNLDDSVAKAIVSGTLVYPFTQSLKYPIYSKNPFTNGMSLVHGFFGIMSYKAPKGTVWRSMDIYALLILKDMGYNITNCDRPNFSNVCGSCESDALCIISSSSFLTSFLFY